MLVASGGEPCSAAAAAQCCLTCLASCFSGTFCPSDCTTGAAAGSDAATSRISQTCDDVNQAMSFGATCQEHLQGTQLTCRTSLRTSLPYLNVFLPGAALGEVGSAPSAVTRRNSQSAWHELDSSAPPTAQEQRHARSRARRAVNPYHCAERRQRALLLRGRRRLGAHLHTWSLLMHPPRHRPGKRSSCPPTWRPQRCLLIGRRQLHLMVNNASAWAADSLTRGQHSGGWLAQAC